MLAWNRRKVRQLTSVEIALFIVGRVLAAFGIGLVLPAYFPKVAVLGWPSVVFGVVLLLIAGKGFARRAAAAD